MRAGAMVIGEFKKNSRKFLNKYPSNEKAVRVSQTKTAFKNTTADAGFTQNSSKCHFDALIFPVLARRNPSNFCPLRINNYPYYDGEHLHGNRSGETPLVSHHAAHCGAGTAGHFMVGVAA